MDDQQLLRYSRHILLPEIGIEGQQKWLNSHALIIGAGGLGSPAAMFLAASGVGHITLCDDDTVDLSNLQRQLLHHTHTIEQAKVQSAKATLQQLNPEIHITALQERIDEQRLHALIKDAHIVLDCSDNFTIRYIINRVCYAQKIPLVSGAAIKFEGQVNVFNFQQKNTPCYQCLYPEQLESETLRCATTGVFAPLVGIVGSMQAAEALKILAGLNSLCGRMLLINALDMNIRSVKLAKDPHCNICKE